ncbi:shikimate dehydrogenase [Vibrio panuliri]|uniref:Shikimate dehydrogenase n=1 Tax=Vibrio panuliri TaxID=1381081 RepID=A0A1Q9HAJ4_9VIBR|nr:NeuD/PglB/VioB family sugar acetyltransferase [Vibrio panuliri]OLQ86150.1 shikimate dehydrogenase [Vibrio panuliri]
MNKIDRPIVLIGGGGHASVLADILMCQGKKIVAVIAPDEISERSIFAQLLRGGAVHYRQDSDIKQFAPTSVYLVNGLGMMPKSKIRKNLTKQFLSQGYEFAQVICDSAKISSFSRLDEGVQVLGGAIIHAESIIGAHSIINSGALIEHDCNVGEYNHIAPRAILCGKVVTSESVFVGAGATIIQNVNISRNAVVGAGVTITRTVLQDQVCYPCRTNVE